MKGAKAIGAAGLLGILLAFGSCALPNMPDFTANPGPESLAGTTGGDGSPLGYRLSGDTVELRWNASVGDVTSYRIYYRARGQADWALLAEVPPSGVPSFEVNRADTGYGSFEFAVSSVAGDATESAKHTSIDHDADPPGGWYIIWE